MLRTGQLADVCFSELTKRAKTAAGTILSRAIALEHGELLMRKPELQIKICIYIVAPCVVPSSGSLRPPSTLTTPYPGLSFKASWVQGRLTFPKKVLDFAENEHLRPLVNGAVAPVVWENEEMTHRKSVTAPRSPSRKGKRRAGKGGW